MLTPLPILLINAGAVAGLLVYWETRELLTSRANKHQGRHPRPYRIGIRLLMPLMGLLLILQLLGFMEFRIPLPLAADRFLFFIGQAIFWAGAAGSIWARETLGRHWAHAAEYQVIPNQNLITSGPYRYVRHPIYTALLAIFIGTQFIMSSWFILLAFPLFRFIHWQAVQEEQLLLQSFGEKYRQYQQRTSMVWPLPFPNQKGK